MTSPAGGWRRGRIIAALVLALVAVGGVIAGVTLDRLCLLPERPWSMGGPGSPDGPGGPGGSHGHRPPPGGGPRERFAREVGLTPQQQVRVDTIMRQQRAEIDRIRGEVQPRLDSILERTRNQLDSVLTPEQRRKAEEIRRRHPRRPGDELMGPPPPPPPLPR